MLSLQDRTIKSELNIVLKRPGETIFAAFMHPRGVEAHYAEVAAGAPSQRQFDELRASVADPRIFDEKAPEFAAQEGVAWGEFVLRGLGIAGLRRELREEGYAMRRRLGMRYVNLAEVHRVTTSADSGMPTLQIGVAYLPSYIESNGWNGSRCAAMQNKAFPYESHHQNP